MVEALFLYITTITSSVPPAKIDKTVVNEIRRNSPRKRAVTTQIKFPIKKSRGDDSDGSDSTIPQN